MACGSIVVGACIHHIHRLKQVHRLLGLDRDVTVKLVPVFILSRLDYCNAVLAGLSKFTISLLQRAQNAAARLVTRIGLHFPISTSTTSLHSLPVQYRIIFKLCLLVQCILNEHHRTLSTKSPP